MALKPGGTVRLHRQPLPTPGRLAEGPLRRTCGNRRRPLGGWVVALPGRSLAERFFTQYQWFSLELGMQQSPLPRAGTCNMAVSRGALEAVGGFREVRSGGDVDLGWRVAKAGLGTMHAVPEAITDWAGRTDLRALFEQFHRYGAARVWLEREHGLLGDHANEPGPARALVRAVRDARLELHRDSGTLSVATARVATELAWWWGRRGALRSGSAGADQKVTRHDERS